MSIRGMIDVAAARGTPAGPLRRTGVEPPGGAADEAGQQERSSAGIGVLISLVPVEIITLYTAFVAGSVSMSTPSASFLAEYAKTHETAFDHAQTAHLAWVRWTVYGLLAACTVGVVYFGWRRARKETDDRKAPVPEMSAATLAFLAWGLAMPGGLLGPYVATADLSFVSLAIATVAAGLLLALGFGTLRSPSKKLK